ncbi:GNAT family N-acetyltransferase [Subtercola sp. YIM 133946]|uniref:GNAT family N-acetyltransferase n=1 Tax=Subtercola sp. YIM 133946 TaxID=3118909 RepID=UPI002F942D28
MDETFRALESEDVEALQALLESAPQYAEQVTGYPPGPSDAVSSLIGRPEGLTDDQKYGFGLWVNGELVAFADVLRGYPTPDAAYIGLLIVRGDRQSSGFGSRLHAEVLREATGWPGIQKLRTGIIETNAASSERFWVRRGYRPTGEVRPYQYDKLRSSVALWELPISR